MISFSFKERVSSVYEYRRSIYILVIFVGISISQQHLVWRSTELNDEKTIEDYEIQDGAKLRLIPAMRGGPINIRRGMPT